MAPLQQHQARIGSSRYFYLQAPSQELIGTHMAAAQKTNWHCSAEDIHAPTTWMLLFAENGYISARTVTTEPAISSSTPLQTHLD
jgi:hypothetical protein